MDYTPVSEEKRIRSHYPGLLAALTKAAPKYKYAEIAALTVSDYIHDPDLAVDELAPVYANWLWQQHREIYNIDHDLFVELLQQARRERDADAKLPADLLLNLPFPCIFVNMDSFAVVNQETGEQITDRFAGGFYIFNDRWDEGVPTLCALAEMGEGERWAEYYLPITGTISDSMEKLLDTWREEAPDLLEGRTEQEIQEELAAESLPVLLAAQIVLYLQAVNADTQRRPAPRQTKTKGKGRSSAAASRQPRITDVGIHVGQTIRKARETAGSRQGGTGGTGTQQRPHSRRGHFQGYWSGPRSDPDKRKLTVKWVAPYFVHPEGLDELPTIHKVEK